VDTRLSITGLLVVLLAVWRITHLLWGEDGPGDIFVRLRRLAGETFFGHLLDCFYCLSLWIALPFAWFMGIGWPQRFVLWFAFSGGAILLQRVTADKTPPPTAEWHETAIDSHPTDSSADSNVGSKQEDHSHVMLR
jgi:hypothetical protein